MDDLSHQSALPKGRPSHGNLKNYSNIYISIKVETKEKCELHVLKHCVLISYSTQVWRGVADAMGIRLLFTCRKKRIFTFLICCLIIFTRFLVEESGIYPLSSFHFLKFMKKSLSKSKLNSPLSAHFNLFVYNFHFFDYFLSSCLASTHHANA